MMKCCAPFSHITDSRFFRAGFTTDEARRVFCDYRRLQRWLDVELALAACQAAKGIIPAAALPSLEETARLNLLDIGNIQESIKTSGHSLMPLLKAWEKITNPASGRFIHFGATTQDIQDSAQSMELKDIFAIIDRDLGIIISHLRKLAFQHRETVIIGRTHGQPALSTTFGLKIAVWLDEMLRNADRLKACKERALVGQLFGGVGTMDALRTGGKELLECFSARLGLAAPLTAWHAARDRQAEMLSVMAILAGGIAKIGNEICQLSRSEIGELEEPFHLGKIGSSTMPHKRNPELSEQVVVLARLIKSNCMLGYDALINEHERDYRAVRLEWLTITDSSLYLCGALGIIKFILENLVVHEEVMKRNCQAVAELISTEALMFLLGEKIGKQRAHQLLYTVSMSIHDTGRSLIDQLLEQPEVKGVFSREMLEKAVAPANNIGLARSLTDTVIQAADDWLSRQQVITPDILRCPLENESGNCMVPCS